MYSPFFHDLYVFTTEFQVAWKFVNELHPYSGNKIACVWIKFCNCFLKYKLFSVPHTTFFFFILGVSTFSMKGNRV